MYAQSLVDMNSDKIVVSGTGARRKGRVSLGRLLAETLHGADIVLLLAVR